MIMIPVQLCFFLAAILFIGNQTNAEVSFNSSHPGSSPGLHIGARGKKAHRRVPICALVSIDLVI